MTEDKKAEDKKVAAADKASEKDAAQAKLDSEGRVVPPKPDKDAPKVVNPRLASADPGSPEVIAHTKESKAQLDASYRPAGAKDGPVEGPHTDPEAKAASDRLQAEATKAAKDNK